MIQEEETETTVNLEINITSPSSPFLPLQIYHFKKQINVPITTKIEDTNTSMVGGGATENNSNGIFGFFKSFFQGFSQNTLQTKKHNNQNEKHLDKLFYSGNSEPVITEPIITEPIITEPIITEPIITEPIITEPVITEPIITEPVITEPVITEPVITEPIITEPIITEPIITEPVITEPVITEPVITEPVITEPIITEPVITEESIEIEITKITLISDKIDLRESLKGTKISFLEKRKDLPSHYV